MAKDSQRIKFEADVSNFNTNIKSSEKNITSLNNKLKLNQAQLKGNSDNTDLLAQRITTLKQKYDEQGQVVENTRKKLEKAVEIFGENSKEAENLKNKMMQAETAQQNIQNEIDKTNKQLNEQTNKLITTNKKWTEAGEAIQDYGSKIESAGNKLSIISGLVGGAAVASVKSAINFETAFTGVTKTVDATEQELAELREGILELSTEIPSSATEISAVAESAGQLGIQTENILSFSKAMIDLGNSTNLTSEEAASQLAKFANIMQMSQKDFDKLGSSIVDLGNNFATTEADIVSMAMRLAGAGKQVGFSEGEVLGLATALSSVGIEAEMGGSAISKAMVKMQNAVEQGGTKLDTVLKKTGMTLRSLELMSANDSKGFKELSQSIGMTSTEVKQLITAGTNLEDFASVSGMTAKEFKKAWKDDAAGALTAFIKGLGSAEEKGESAITMLSEMGLTEVRLRDSLLRAANAGDLFNNALETGKKAWTENIALTNEANKRYGTAESQLTMLKNEATKTAIEFGDELAPSLRQIIKDSKPMLNSIKKVVESFANLDEKTKKNILSIGALIIATGPAIKIGGTAIKTIGSITKSIGTASGALAVLKGNTDDVSNSSKKLANLISAIKSPTGLLTIGVTTLAGAIIYLNTNLTEEQKEIKKVSEEISRQREEYIGLQETRLKELESNVSEIDRTRDLRNELSKLVDENGNVKEGYKSRVDFILNELNEALGKEYELNGNLIEGYQELKDEIDSVISKKRAETILLNEQESYNDAMKNIDEYKQKLADLNMTEEDYINKKSQIEDKRKEMFEKTKTASHGARIVLIANYEKEIEALENQVSSYENAKQNISDAYSAIEKYEQDYALFSEGTAESIEQINARIGMSYTDLSNATAEQLKEQINVSTTNLNFLKERYEQTQNEITKAYLDAEENRLESTINALIQQTSTVNENAPEVITAWQTLAKNSYSEYYDAIAPLDEELKKKIEEMTGVTAEKTPELIAETEKMMSSVLEEVNKNSDFKQEALDNLKSFLKGLEDNELRELLKQAGVDNIDKVIDGIKEGNLAEDEGMKILSNLNEGLNNTTWKDKLWSTARGIASKLSGLLTVKASVDGKTSDLPGHKDGLDYVPYDNYVARLHKGERVLTAKENKQYMADNIENKITNRNIVVQFYPQTMSESEIQKAERYISKKWGLAL